MNRLIFFAAMAALSLGGCVKDKPFVGGPHLELLSATEMPPPDGAVNANGQRIYQIGPFDKLSVRVFRAPDLSQSITVDGTGAASFPLLGELAAEGLTTHQLESVIENGLRGRYIKDPQVTVDVEDAVNQTITVEGEVEKPGIYPVRGDVTLLKAMAIASGPTEFARLKDVVILRTVDGRSLAGLYDLEDIRRGLYPDPDVYPGDLVIIGDSPARRRFQDILAGSTLITTPIIALVQQF
ncbi:polysaccharide biosynthesis/export family protein [Allopontixanthobacter sediminis]|nr:polysaccharide biosynthesis/export family protein [Allopontixanthobacter sediminis]